MRSTKYCWGSESNVDFDKFLEGDLDSLTGNYLDFLSM